MRCVTFRLVTAFFMGLMVTMAVIPMSAFAAKPNILVIWGDDIGWSNISVYNHGMMGYQTPNIDRIAKEGAMFTDWYAQQSCTVHRRSGARVRVRRRGDRRRLRAVRPVRLGGRLCRRLRVS